MTDHDSRLWSVVVFLGVGVGLALGALVVLLLRDRRSPLISMQPMQPMQPMLSGYGAGFGSNVDVSALPKSFARTVTVGTTPMQILRAQGSRNWKLQVRVVTPPGVTVFFEASNRPGEGLTLPTGNFQDFWLAPGEDLYATGSQAGIQISVSGGEQ